MLNVPSKIVFSCPINKNVDRRVGGKFRISRIKTTDIVNHDNYLAHLFHVLSNGIELIENGRVFWSFKSNAG